jgi:hypothetical protein
MAPSARVQRQRDEVVQAVQDRLWPDERIVAVLPFASTPKRPKGPEGKVREGIYLSARRYRPLVVTNQRLLVVNAWRTPYPRGVLAEFPASAASVVDVLPARFDQQRLELDLPGEGVVPFILGRFDLPELDEFEAALGRGASSSDS